VDDSGRMENCGGHLLREALQKMTRCISSLLIIIKIKDIDTYLCSMFGGCQAKKPNSSDE
jgi:hypothetical protein